MFGSTPPFEYDRPFAAFLRPSLRSPFRRRSKDTGAGAGVLPRDRPLGVSPAATLLDALPPDGNSRSKRSSVASTRSSTSSQAAVPSLCSSSGSVGGWPSSPERGTSWMDWAAGSTTTMTQTGKDAAMYTHTPPPTTLYRAAPDTLRCGKCAADVAFAAQIVSKCFTGRHGRAYLVSPPPAAAGDVDHLLAPVLSTAGLDERRGCLANVRIGRPEQRQLATGTHVVADISCAVCRTKLGWKYVDARDPAQHYKVGKFILETARVVRSSTWEDGAADPDPDPDMDGHRDDLVADLDALFYARTPAKPHPVAPALAAAEAADGGYFAPFGPPALVDPAGTARRLLSYAARPAAPAVVSDVEFDSDDDEECFEIFAGTWNAEVVARRRSVKVVSYA